MRIGIAGFGFMGRMHYGCWTQIPGAEVVAVCDSNPEIATELKNSTGNIAGLPQEIDLSKLNIYTDFDTMLQQGKLDAVSITLPSYLHAELTCKALESGVNVLCEKPMALDFKQCRQMIDTAEQTGKHLMVAHCIRFWPEYANTRQIIESGRYGKVLVANFQRLSSMPGWSHHSWLTDPAKSGGMILDLHIHDTDFIQNLFGIPSEVKSRAIQKLDIVEHIKTDYLYGNDMLVSAEASWLASDSFGFRMNFDILLEDASIIYDSTKTPALQIFPKGSDPITPSLSLKDGYYHEIEYFFNCLQGKETEKIITMQQSLESVQIIEAEIESLRTKKTVKLNLQ